MRHDVLISRTDPISSSCPTGLTNSSIVAVELIDLVATVNDFDVPFLLIVEYLFPLLEHCFKVAAYFLRS